MAVVVVSGKRKSGKDFLSEILHKRLSSEKCAILRLSAPLKEQYAQEHQLDFQRLLDASEYKEKYRADMIRWGEEKRQADPGYFCRLISQGPGSEKAVWIISDARRKTDIEYFETHHKERLIKVRVEATLEVRKSRGWKFTSGVDDAESECGLDSGVTWDFLVNNNNDEDELDKSINDILDAVRLKMNS